MARVGDTLSGVLDDNDRQVYSFDKVNNWADGVVMDDTKVDNVMYIKVGNEYFKRASSKYKCKVVRGKRRRYYRRHYTDKQRYSISIAIQKRNWEYASRR